MPVLWVSGARAAPLFALNCMHGEVIPARPARHARHGSQAWGTPDGEPAGQVLLDPQVVAEHALDLQFQGVVAVLAAERGERVERAPLVQVNQREAAVIVVTEGDKRA